MLDFWQKRWVSKPPTDKISTKELKFQPRKIFLDIKEKKLNQIFKKKYEYWTKIIIVVTEIKKKYIFN